MKNFGKTPDFYDGSNSWAITAFSKNVTAARRIPTMDHFVHSSTFGPDSDVVCHIELPDTDWMDDLEAVCTLAR